MRLCGDDLVEMDDVRVVESAVVVELACEVWCKGLWDFFNSCACAGEPVGGEMHRAISACVRHQQGVESRDGAGTLADDPAEGVVADDVDVFGAKLVCEFMVCGRELRG